MSEEKDWKALQDRIVKSKGQGPKQVFKVPGQGMDVRVAIVFTETMLGTKTNKELLLEHIASKHPEFLKTPEVVKDEIDSVPEDVTMELELEKGTTVFARDAEGQVMVFGYQVLGAFKGAQAAFQRITGLKMPAWKKKLAQLVFILERDLPLRFPEDFEELTICERPLKAETMQGDRVSIARSEEAPIGTALVFTVRLLDKGLRPQLESWLGFGSIGGFGQWRGSGKGQFQYQILSETKH